MPELRQNPATKEWVIIATERAKRPEDFCRSNNLPPLPEHDPGCPFCEGNESTTPPEILAYRNFGTCPNTPGWWIRIVPNKFAALVPEGNLRRIKSEEFFRYMDGVGEHEVLIEDPKHNATFHNMNQKQIEEIFLAYRERYLALREDPRYEMIIIFKNHGFNAGTSLIHTHSQLVATPVTPSHIRHRLEEAMRYFDDNGECVYCVEAKKEQKVQERIVFETDNFLSFIPFAASSPFEIMVLPKEHVSSFESSPAGKIKELAYVMKQVMMRIHVGLTHPDYNYMIFSSPCHEKDVEYYHWHLKIVPRVASVAGFEMGSGIYINTVIPEKAAQFLRNVKF
ncbi:MAG: galactose-1-phosphate uridylyltransferase [Candidatus Margulisbacteria bacterium]|nr:galactose-1-phosphate uridylyltransferase [Candidatus Margulisiibacteriota bacterium]